MGIRIEKARHRLIDMGFRCLSSGKWGLPSYTDIEAWTKGISLAYLVYDKHDDGWTILVEIEQSNDIEATLRAVEAMDHRDNPPQVRGITTS